MTGTPFGQRATPKGKTTQFDEEGVINDLAVPEAKAESAEDEKIRAETKDQISTTKLKESLASHVFYFMCVWCAFMLFGLIFYLNHQINKDLEIPKEVILGMFTSTTIVIGLVGYILKGLFGSNGQ